MSKPEAFQRWLREHVDRRFGYPGTLGTSVRDTRTYLDWLTEELGVDRRTIERWLAGERMPPPEMGERLLEALGYKALGDERWLSACDELGAMRRRKKGPVAQSRAAPALAPNALPKQAETTAVAGAGAGPDQAWPHADVAAQHDRPRQKARALAALRLTGSQPFVDRLCTLSALGTDEPSRAAEALVAMRTQAALPARIVLALKQLRESEEATGRPLDATKAKACRVAATQLFALAMSYRMLADWPELPAGSPKLLHIGTPSALEAALCGEEVLDGVLDFEPVRHPASAGGEPASSARRASQLRARARGYLTEDDMSGIAPGFELGLASQEALDRLIAQHRSYIADWLDAQFAQAVSDEFEPRLSFPTDAQLRQAMLLNEQMDLPVVRLAVDLSRPEAGQRVLLGRELERAGVPCVTHGVSGQPPEGFITGFVLDPDAEAPDVLVDRFLRVRAALGAALDRNASL